MEKLTGYFTAAHGVQSITYAFLILIVSYITGSLFIRQNRSATGAFLSIAIGLTTITLSFAIISTGGKTIFLAALPAFAYLIYHYRKYFAFRIAVPDISVVIVTVVSLLLLSIKNYLFFDWQTGVPDNAFYSRISYAIYTTGIENEFHILNQLYPGYNGLSPYHYFELWLNGLTQTLSGLSSLTSYITITPLVIETVLLFGLIAFASNSQNSIRTVAVIISFLILAASCINIFGILDYTALKDFSYIYSSIFCSNEVKFTIPVLLFAVVLISVRNGSYRDGAILLSLFAVFNYAMLPSASLAFIGYCFVYRKVISRKDLITATGIYLLMIAILFYLYHSSFSTNISRDGVQLQTLFNSAQGFGILFTGIKIFIASLLSIPVNLIFFFIPSIFVLSLLTKENTQIIRHGLVLYCLLLSAGAAGWALLNTTLNSVQLFSISAHSFMILVAALFPIYKSNLKSLTFFVLVIVSGITLTAFNIYSKAVPEINGTPSKEFTRSVADITSSNLSIRTGFIKNPTSYTNGFHCYPHFSILLPSLATYTDEVIPLSIGEFYCRDCDKSDACKKGIKLGLLYQWFNKHPGSSVCDFVKNYNIGFFLVEKGALMPECGQTRLLLTDFKTDMQLYRLEF